MVSSSRLPKVGDIFGERYRLEALLGRGGVGAVFRATDTTSDQDLALKVHLARRKGQAGRASALRFRREYHTLVRLRHPSIVEAFEYGLHDLTPYYTMEILDGRDVREMGQTDPTKSCEILREVASALALVHARHLVHRDISLRNVRCTASGRAKIIDFGLLATAGSVGNPSGTPPFVAPENLRRLPIDHRTDLFSLGALAFYLLTGQHAFAARTLGELEGRWRQTPPPPSRWNGDIPSALDDLVLRMLAIEPLGRPTSAAEVIDRLSAISELKPLPQGEVAQGYLASSLQVGRHREMSIVAKQLGRLSLGTGTALVVEAPTGMGKSRFLREVALEAQVSGALVVRAAGTKTDRGPLAVFRELAADMAAQAPDLHQKTAKERAHLLGRAVPEIAHLAGSELVPAGSDPAEERLRVQKELADWFLDVAASRRTVIIVDDIQRSDEGSAAVLATLAFFASTRPLLLVCALRTDEKARAKASVHAMVEAGLRLRLRGLTSKDVESLVRAIFGDVSGAKRLARWVRKQGGGSPFVCTELARHLVDTGEVRYVDGMWVVPEQPKVEQLPRGLTAVLEARLQNLSARAKSVAEVLSVHGGDLSIDLCRAIASEMDEEALFDALDELVDQEVIVGGEGTFTIRHDGFRETAVSDLSAEREKELHLRIGEALLSELGESPEAEAEIGWHLLRGGEQARGATLLARAGKRLHDAQSFSDSLRPLSASLQVLEQGATPLTETLELRTALLLSGALTDRAMVTRYAETTLSVYDRLSGLRLARKLLPLLGGRVALAVGIFGATVRRFFSGAAKRGPKPLDALRAMIVVVPSIAAAQGMAFDWDAAIKLAEMVAPLKSFGKRVPAVAYHLTANLRNVILGQDKEVRKTAHLILEIVDVDKKTPLTDLERALLQGASRFMLAIHSAMALEADWRIEVEEIEKLELQYFDVAALLVRLAHNRLCGNEERALELERELEMRFIQGGSMWLWESELYWVSAMAYCLTRDMLGLKRCVERLRRTIDDGIDVRHFLALAEAQYAMERGKAEEASRIAQEAIEELRPGERLARPALTIALAEARLASGELSQSRKLCERLLDELDLDRPGDRLHRIRIRRVLALIFGKEGDGAQSHAILDELLEMSLCQRVPVLTGTMWEAKAEVCLATDDPNFAQCLGAMERAFRPTKNPALVARTRRLAAYAVERQAIAQEDAIEVTATADTIGLLPQGTATELDTEIAPEQDLPSAGYLSGCHGRAQRAHRALTLLLLSSGTSQGFLFLLQGDSFELAAPKSGDEPATAEEKAVRLALGVTSTESQGEADSGAFALTVEIEGSPKVVGALVLVDGGHPPAPLLAQVAQELYDAGDVSLWTTERGSETDGSATG